MLWCCPGCFLPGVSEQTAVGETFLFAQIWLYIWTILYLYIYLYIHTYSYCKYISQDWCFSLPRFDLQTSALCLRRRASDVLEEKGALHTLKTSLAPCWGVLMVGCTFQLRITRLVAMGISVDFIQKKNSYQLGSTNQGLWDTFLFKSCCPSASEISLECPILNLICCSGQISLTMRTFGPWQGEPRWYLEACKIWDINGLLVLKPDLVEPCLQPACLRIFNNFKNETPDRQIGDRRGRNQVERKLERPSRFLPTGPVLANLELDPELSTLSIDITDPKDYYHHMRTSTSRAFTNQLWPPWLLRSAMLHPEMFWQ